MVVAIAVAAPRTPSPIKPPGPTINGHATGVGNAAIAAAPITRETGNKINRCQNSRGVSSGAPLMRAKPPQMIIGATNKNAPPPKSCSHRSAIAAPAGPAILVTGAAVAVLKLGSLIENVASAAPTQIATSTKARPPARKSTLWAQRRTFSISSENWSRFRVDRRA